MTTFFFDLTISLRSRNVRRLAVCCCVIPILLFVVAGCERTSETTVPLVTIQHIKTKGGVEMVSVPSGSFLMGSSNADGGESPAHQVSVDAFLMDCYEVTQEEYEKFVIGNPSKFKDPKHPIERVRWVEAALYCNGRSSAEGLKPCYNEETFDCDFQASGYRLPTEAEWEYACRAGSKTDYCFGNGAQKLAEYAWFKGDSSERTHPVGTKKPNAWGLYDMHGNVGEWCNDLYDGKYYEKSATSNPCNLAGDLARSLRGGSWNSGPERCRSSSRSGEAPGDFIDACFKRPDIGFRCVRRPDSDVPIKKDL